MLGVISNADGDFKLPGRFRAAGDVIEISCIGYLTQSVPMNQLSEGKMTLIRMKQSEEQLAEVVVKAKKMKALTAYRIVQMAISEIPDNYPEHPYSYVAYYRDYQSKEQQYINLNEALVHVYDSGFQTNDQLATHIRLLEYKKNTEFARDTTTEVPYDNQPASFDKGKNKYIPNAVLSSFGGNELSILRVHDAIRNYRQPSYSFVNQFNTDFITNHFFKLQGSVYLNATPLYCIEFESKVAAAGPLHFAKGKIYIQKNDFAIHKLEYACYNKTMKETQLMYDIQVEYARSEGRMYLNYISFNNFFKVRNERDYRVIDMVYDQRTNCFIIDVNNNPDRVSSIIKRNYHFSFDDTALELKWIEVNGKRIYVYLSEKEHARLLAGRNELGARLKMKIENLRDMDNRELDKVTLTSVHQFRELFVQKMNEKEAAPGQALFLQKDKPLSRQAMEPVAAELSSYWMNSPLKKE